MAGHIQFQRSPETWELINYPVEFWLLSLIALRARRTDVFRATNLKPGEALIGDIDRFGISERVYRTAKKRLSEWKFASFRGTSKGTIATLTGTMIYDINIQLGDERKDERETNKRRTRDEQETTNKECIKNEPRIEKKRKEKIPSSPAGDGAVKSPRYSDEFETFWKAYPRKVGKPAALKSWDKQNLDSIAGTIVEGLKKQLSAGMLDLREKMKYCPHPATWLNGQRWEDEIQTTGMDPTTVSNGGSKHERPRDQWARQIGSGDDDDVDWENVF